MSQAKMQVLRFKLRPPAPDGLDPVLLGLLAAIAALGLVMMTSASIATAERVHGEPLYYLYRQGSYWLAGLAFAVALSWVPLRYWQALAPLLLLLGMVLLAVILLPGVGKTVNNSTRWLVIAGVNIQVSEFVKLFLVLYLAGFLARHHAIVASSPRVFLAPVLVLGAISFLLLLEPDFGSAVVMAAITLGMLFLAGVRLRYFLVLFVLLAGAMLALAKAAPYRWERVMSFLNPWEDPFNKGFQLSQSLIAFGRGEWLGVGLGASVQKQFYLPEAHTDFVYAILAEELGFAGVMATLLLFALLAWRALRIGQAALARGDLFAGHLAHGIGLWFAFQAFVNMGVNMGVLPTKGLTLPFMSYGGSSLVVSVIAAMLLLRVAYENGLPTGKEKTT